MAIRYGYFNSVNGDRKYSADDISNYFVKLISNGVFATPANAMQVQENSGMNVQVSAGWAFINCKWLSNDAPYILTIDAADVALNRIDRVVVRLNSASDTRNITIAVVKGTPASSPTAPALTRSGGVYELSLAQVLITAGATSISQSAITDERADTSVCGFVTGLIDQIDTTNLFAQFTVAFEQWFNEMKDQLTEDAAGALQEQIDAQNAIISQYAPVTLYTYDITKDSEQEKDATTPMSLTQNAWNFERLVIEYTVKTPLGMGSTYDLVSVYVPAVPGVGATIPIALEKMGIVSSSSPSGDVNEPVMSTADYEISNDGSTCSCTDRYDTAIPGNIRIFKILGYNNRNAPVISVSPYNETQTDSISDSIQEVQE
jgi:hypothetical protein